MKFESDNRELGVSRGEGPTWSAAKTVAMLAERKGCHPYELAALVARWRI